jgi:hypothetical protein
MKVRDAALIALPAAALAAGLATYAHAGDGGDEGIPVEYSYDTGSHTARVFAFCIGADAMYLLGDTDDWYTAPSSENCGEGGFLLDPANDGEWEES